MGEKICMLLWGIWCNCNEKVWRTDFLCPSLCFRSCMDLYDQCHVANATQHSSNSVHSNENRYWVKPPNEIMKLNTDATCHAQFGFICLGAILCDHEGGVHVVYCKWLSGRFQPYIAEVVGLKKALSWIIEARYEEDPLLFLLLYFYLSFIFYFITSLSSSYSM